MPNFTPNYNLEKPLASESYSIDVFNANSDKVDTAIKGVSNDLNSNINNYKFTARTENIRNVSESGNFFCTGNNAGMPYNSDWYVTVEVKETQKNLYRKIKAKRATSNQEYTMYMDNGTWSDWKLDSNGSLGINHYVSVSGTNNLTGTISSVPLEEGLELTIKNSTTNTGNVTFNFNSSGAKQVLRNGNVQLTPGSLAAGGIYKLIYNGTNFILLEEGGVRIKSIQRGSINFNANSTYQAITISSVDVNKSYVRINFTGGGTNPSLCLVGANLANSTTIGLWKGNNDTSNLQLDWEVVEYSGNVNVQRGILEIPSGTVREFVTITPVDLNRTFVFNSNRAGSTTSRTQQQNTIASFTANDTLRFYRDSSDGYSMNYWQVVELG